MTLNPRYAENDMRRLLAQEDGWIRLGRSLEKPVIVRLITISQGKRRHLGKKDREFIAQAVHVNEPWLRKIDMLIRLKNLVADAILRGDLSLGSVMLGMDLESRALDNQNDLDEHLASLDGRLLIAGLLIPRVEKKVAELRGITGYRLEMQEEIFVERNTLVAALKQIQTIEDLKDFMSWLAIKIASKDLEGRWELWLAVGTGPSHIVRSRTSPEEAIEQSSGSASEENPTLFNKHQRQGQAGASDINHPVWDEQNGSEVRTRDSEGVKQMEDAKEQQKETYVGEMVIFVDEKGVEHNALVTAVWPGEYQGQTDEPGLNLVHVLNDESRSDDYGRQITRDSSVIHESAQPAHGMYWKRP